MRWDRLGRAFLLVLVVGIIGLYIGPALSYWETYNEAKDRRAQVERLRQENAKLRERRAALKDPRVLEREARKLGMIKPGERPYVVDGLPKD